ncbi:nucleolar pre-ribosomal-associated protein 1 [Rhizoclosmatium sp. JEL0117]|nr:nucleolar pre-ribosomal-associated protein 1 [Rhizoclosmatium sp. JEL0117]
MDVDDPTEFEVSDTGSRPPSEYSASESGGGGGGSSDVEAEADDAMDVDDDNDNDQEWTNSFLSAKSAVSTAKAKAKAASKVPDLDIKKNDANADDEDDDDDNEREEKRAALQRPMTLSEVQSFLSSENVEVIAQGLSRFNYRLKRLASGAVDHEISEESDLLRAYYKSSPEAIEVLTLWYFQQKHEIARLDIPIMETLSLTITCSRLLGARATGTSLAKTIIRTHMKQLYRNLSSKKHALMQVTMRLLAAMVVQSSSCARELFDGFNFTLKALPFLFKVRKATDAGRMEDVRGLYIRFLLGFLMYGDAAVKKGILETKDTVSSIFKGAQEDHYLTIDFVLSVLKRKVIDDESLSRTVKLAFFNNYVLELITKLCSRDDPSDTNSVSEPDAEGGAQKTVAELAQDFLTHLCTRAGFGICIPEPGWLQIKKIVGGGGEGGPVTTRYLKHRNNHLLKWITYLRPVEVPMEMNLLLEVLRNCPELVQPFWAQVTLSYDPRLSPKWLTNMAMATNIITLPVPSLLASAKSHAHNDPSTILTPPSLTTLVENILPSPLNRIAMSRGLQHASQTVKHVTAFVLGRALEKLGAVLEEMERVRIYMVNAAAASVGGNGAEDGLVGASGKSVGEEWVELKDALMEEMRKRVPEVQTVLSLHMKVSEVGAGATAVVQKGKKAEKVEADETEVSGLGEGVAEMEEDATVTPVVLQCASMRLVREYQKHFPEQMAESRFDYGKLVPADITTAAVEIQQGVLEFLLEVPNFKWWTNPAGSQRSHLQTLLKLYCYSGSIEIRLLAEKVVRHFLASAYIFRNNLDEIPLWLNAVSTFSKLSAEFVSPSVISWFDSACCNAIKSPPKFIDRMSRLVDSVSGSLDPLTQKIISHIYESRTMAESALKFGLASSIDEDGIEAETQAFRSVFPFSPVVAGALDGLSALLRALQKDPKEGAAPVPPERLVQVLNISRCFCIIGLDVLAYTQGTREFLAKLVGDGYAAILLALGIKGKAPKSRAVVKLPDLNEKADCSAIISGALATDQTKKTTLLQRLIQFGETNEIYSAGAAIITRLIPCLGGSAFSVVDNANQILTPTSTIPNLLAFLSSSNAKLTDDLKSLLSDTLSSASSSKIGVAYNILSWSTQIADNVPIHGLEFVFECLATSMMAAHPIIANAFLKPQNRLSSASLDLIQKFLPVDYSRSTSGIYDEYIHLVRDSLLSELSPFANYQISESVVNAFEIVRSFMTESDLNRILEAVLVIPVLNNVSQLTVQNRLISCILTVESRTKSQSSSEYRHITSQAFKRLLKLLQDCPSQELDQIFESAVLATLSPSSLQDGRVAFRVSAPAGVGMTDCQIYAQVASLIDLETISALLSHPTPSRLNALKYLVASSPLIRGFVLKDAASLKGAVAEIVLEGSLLGLTSVTSTSEVTWTETSTEAERTQVGKLKNAADAFITKMVEHILNGGETSLVKDERSIVSRIGGLRLFSSKSADFFPNLLQSFLSTTELTDVRGSLFWLNRHFDCLVLAESFEEGAQSTIFSVFIKAIRAYLQSRKRVEFPVGSQDAELQFETYAAELMAKIESHWRSSDNVQLLLSSGFASGEGLSVLTDFFKTGLKYRLTDPRVLEFLSQLAGIVYAKSESFHPIPLEQLYKMINTHSQFKLILRPIPTTSSNASSLVKKINKHHPSKAPLIRLILALISHSPTNLISEIRTTIIPAVSISYMGTNAPSDREILRLWEFYESKHGLSIASNAVHWSQIVSLEEGENAFTLIANSSGATGTVSPAAASEALNQIDPSLMLQSVQGFSTNGVQPGNIEDLYDAGFFLPLIATAVKLGGERLDTKLLVESNALGMAVMALASEVEDVRKAGYFILDMTYSHLYKVERLAQKLQLTLLLTMLKNGITERTDTDFPQIPTIIALFFSHAISIVSKPEHYMYPLVNQFLLSRPLVDFEDVPMFYMLFNSSTDNCRRERVWLYRLLCGGLKTQQDYKLYKRRHVVDLILSFFHFPLADTAIRKLTFEFLYAASNSPQILVDLITDRGLTPFLTTTITSLNLHPSNELALALPRLFTQIARVWFAQPKHSLIWSQSLCTAAVTLVTAVIDGFRGFLAGVGETGVGGAGVWWLTVLRDSIRALEVCWRGCGVDAGSADLVLERVLELLEDVEGVLISGDGMVNEEEGSGECTMESMFVLSGKVSVAGSVKQIRKSMFGVVASAGSVTKALRVVGGTVGSQVLLQCSKTVKWGCTFATRDGSRDVLSDAVAWISRIVDNGTLRRMSQGQSHHALGSVLDVLFRVIEEPSCHVGEPAEVDKKQRVKNGSLKHVFTEFVAHVSVSQDDLADMVVVDLLANILKMVWGGNTSIDESGSLKAVWADQLKTIGKEGSLANSWKSHFETLARHLGTGNNNTTNQPQKKARVA